MDVLNRINQYLPTDLHFKKEDLPLDKKKVNQRLLEFAKKYPDLYAKNIHKIGQLGEELAYEYGHHIGIEDLTHPLKHRIKAFVEAEDRKMQRLPDEEKKKRLIDLFAKVREMVMQIPNNHLVDQGKSRGRGNPDTITRTIGAAVYTVDMKSEPFPFTIKNSLAAGYRSHEMFAAGSQARYAAVQSATSTSEPGAMGKVLVANTENIHICCKDCGTKNGVERSLDDPEIIGRFEARTNRLITKDYVNQLKKQGRKTIIVRDPSTCEAPEGVCQMCYGLNAMGKLPEIGHNIGIEASQTVAEKSTQLVLSTKHNIGGKIKSAIPQGFEAQKILLNTPDYYRGKATVAQIDGVVEEVSKLPTGGWNVRIAGVNHFVGAEVKPTVKVGEQVNKGNIISSGLASPKELVRYAGIHQARKYVVDKLYEANGGDIDKRIFGVIAKGYLDLAKKKGKDDHEIYSYDALVKETEIPHTYEVKTNDKAIIGKFLAEPFLHYSVGTKITESMIKKMREHKIDTIKVSHSPAPIEPLYKTYEQKPLTGTPVWQRLNYRGIKRGLSDELLYHTGINPYEMKSERAKYTLGKL